MKLAKFIDHTLLKPDAQEVAIHKLLDEAKQYHFASVCVSPIWVSYSHEILKDSDVNVVTVIGFPTGATPTSVKVFETKQAIKDGADEVDMVLPVGFLKDKKYNYVETDIRSVVEAANGKTTKVIIETCLLTDEEKLIACKIAKKAGANFVKTSTGFSTHGATPEDVKLMRDTVGNDMGVKASGGVANRAEAEAVIAAGANRIGTSHGVEIING